VPEPIAEWNSARDVWETSQGSICGHLAVFSETWPTSGTTRGGVAYALPTWAPLTAGSASLSLLKTPTAQLAVNGGSQHPDKRKAGGHGPTLADEVEHLLPTPTAGNFNDGESVVTWQQRREQQKARGVNGNGMGTPLAIAVQLLPTPTAMDSGGSRGHRPDGTKYTTTSGVTLTDAVMVSTGVHTAPPSSGGNTSSDDQLLYPPSQDEAGNPA
jgi:hypothetical protein